MPEAMEMPPAEPQMSLPVEAVPEEPTEQQDAALHKRFEFTESDLALIRAAHDFIRSELPAAAWNFGYQPRFPAHFEGGEEDFLRIAEANGYPLYYMTARQTFPVICLGEMPGKGTMFALFKQGGVELFHLTPEETAAALDKRRLSPKRATLAGLTRPNRPIN